MYANKVGCTLYPASYKELCHNIIYILQQINYDTAKIWYILLFVSVLYAVKLDVLYTVCTFSSVIIYILRQYKKNQAVEIWYVVYCFM